MVPLGQLDDRAHPPSRLFAPFRQYKQVYALSYEVSQAFLACGIAMSS
jgi:hypothetical protein